MVTVNTQFKQAEACGVAEYVADRHFEGQLEGRFYRSSCSRGVIDDVQLPTFPPGYHLFSASDVPGKNELPIVENDWPAFADKEVRYIGQVVYLLVGPDPEVLEDLIKQIKITYISSTPAFTISQSQAMKDGPICGSDNQFDHHELIKGDIDKGFAEAVTIIEDSCSTSYQEHLYLETQGVIGYPKEGKIVIEGSMQCPWYVHHCMSHVLGHDKVRAIQCTTGGGFGGKEDFPDVLAGPLAVAVEHLQLPIRLIFNRTEDIAFTSKRHPVEFNYRTGVDKDGKIVAMDLKLDINSGGYFSLSGIVLQRSLTTCTNVYDIPNVRVSGTAWATNTVPNGAFRGFGAPQTCFAIETHLSHVAKETGQDPAAFKQAHFLTSQSKTLTGAEIYGDMVLDQMMTRADELSDYHEKVKSYAAQVQMSDDKFGKRRGIGLAVFQHGCGFAGDLEDILVKAKVAIVKDPQGNVEILASNTDIGQGLSLTFCKIVAETLDIPLDRVHQARPDTDKVPDSGPTVASRSILIVGYLLENAAKELKENWIEGVEQRFEQVYKKPDYHHWDQQTYQGNAYQATSYGINVVEIELDLVTCQSEILGLWAVYDVGHAIDALVFQGQIDGGLVQAIGYGSSEKLELNEQGTFAQKSMADYVIPTSLDVPKIVSSLVENPYEFGPQGAKGGGELTHNGGAAAYVAAVESAIGVNISSIPVTPELISELLYGCENGDESGGKNED
ncbi:xanthine dehydrogenase family protein molybdopterin-binding subunit [Shewanella eurypsychrophilus]|uniref:Xanthine dehydrogenase family protein molybdopterin-binding subunit n=1 Tax=Shewanella eurypsychrophilus TaxID=2593656 RepID=A0ABX6V5V7_9GAMM|nr:MULTISPECIES: xanthine dehydrogenase family protein molybdopterin-binding subunit [Shewanella]QFU22739.1 molybdopterin-dependent oxidoreductase [Shewanella sp. YLB-09]QPG58028.1 xanthine dehydrogenase family protein molybdopterin-binding subunit [Shewanella eurypsychrophilus]